jgi:hypothetical protein
MHQEGRDGPDIPEREKRTEQKFVILISCFQ